MPKKGAKKNKKARESTNLERIALAVLVVVAVVAVILFLLLRTPNETSIAENGAGSVLTGTQTGLSSVTKWGRDRVTGAKSYATLSENYEEAQHEITELQLQVAALEEEANENVRLKKLLGAKDAYSTLDPVYARITARDAGIWFDSFTVNVGTKDGVKANMAVINGDGLVGYVTAVGLNYAKVQSIIDPKSAVACLIERTRDNGVMRGQISNTSGSSECNMYYLPAVNDVIPGDTVITSGVDTRYPKGLTVGTVTEVSRQTDSSDRYIVVTPNVDFRHLEEVLVCRVEIESEENLPSLPTPTPRPSATPAPTATPNPEVSPTPATADDEIYTRTTPTPEDMDETEIVDEDDISDEAGTPIETPKPEPLLPEDIWAQF